MKWPAKVFALLPVDRPRSCKKCSQKRTALVFFSFAFAAIVFSGAKIFAADLEVPSFQALSEPTKLEWYKLLHYQKSKGRSRVRGNNFFLDQDGAIAPEKEYIASFRQMFSDTAEIRQKTQCQYLARRDFFIRRLGIKKEQLVPCHLSDSWLRRLDSNRITIVFASAFLNSAASGFGHTFLKLGSSQHQANLELLDYGINFAARVPDTSGALYALYGLSGYYPGSFGMLPYHQLIKDYTHLEGRDLWQYDLNFDPQETQRMLFHLLELETSYFDYYFLDDNCSFALLSLLEIGRPGLHLIEDEEAFVIPLDTIKRLARQGLVTNISYRPSQETQWRTLEADLTSSQKENIKKVLAKDLAKDLAPQDLDTQSLDAGLAYLGLLSAGNQELSRAQSFQLSTERSHRSGRPQQPVLRSERSPDQSHDSSQVSLGFLQESGQTKNQLHFKFQPAFHDLLSEDSGASRGSHLELLSLTLQSTENSAISVGEFKAIKLVSTKPCTAFEQPISWGVDLGSKVDPWLLSGHRPYLITQLGYRFDYWQEKVSLHLFLSPFIRKSLSEGYLSGVGVTSQIIFRQQRHLRGLLSAEYFSDHNLKLQWSEVMDFGLQNELRLHLALESERPRPDIETWIEAGVRWVHYFSF